jgi:hypothetical protein
MREFERERERERERGKVEREGKQLRPLGFAWFFI